MSWVVFNAISFSRSKFEGDIIQKCERDALLKKKKKIVEKITFATKINQSAFFRKSLKEREDVNIPRYLSLKKKKKKIDESRN